VRIRENRAADAARPEGFSVGARLLPAAGNHSSPEAIPAAPPMMLVLADNYDDQPDADRAGHKAVPVQVGLILAGSI